MTARTRRMAALLFALLVAGLGPLFWGAGVGQASGPTESTPGTVLTLRVGEAAFTVQVNGTSTTVPLDAPPLVVHSRAFLPIRPVVEALGGAIAWEAGEQRVQVVRGLTRLVLWIGQSDAERDGEKVPVDPGNPEVKPFVVPPGRTMLPLRFVAESLGAEVAYEPETQVITIACAETALPGVVLDALSGRPVAAATVTCGELVAVSDSEGRFRLLGPRAGGLVVAASAPGYEPATRSYECMPRPGEPFTVTLVPQAADTWTWDVPARDGLVAHAGDRLTLTVESGAVPPGASLSVSRHVPLSGLREEALEVGETYDISLRDDLGRPIEPRVPALLEFAVPPGEDPANAVVICFQDGEWYVAAAFTAEGLVFGGDPSEDARKVVLKVNHFSMYALAFIRAQAVKGFPVETTVESQRVTPQGNLEVVVRLHQPPQFIGFTGSWYRVNIVNPINLMSVEAPDDPLFTGTGGYLAPGETKRLVLTFYGVGGIAAIDYSMADALPMIGIDWLCRLILGQNLPWPLNAHIVLAYGLEPLIGFLNWQGWLQSAPALVSAIGAYEVSLGEKVRLKGLGAILDIIGGNTIKYCLQGGGANLDDLVEFLRRHVGDRYWPVRPQGMEARLAAVKQGNLWWTFIKTSDLAVSTAVAALLGYREMRYDVVARTEFNVVVTPTQVTLSPGQTVSFKAQPRAPDGELLSYRAVGWRADGGGSIDSQGTFTAGAGGWGITTVTAVVDCILISGRVGRRQGTAYVTAERRQASRGNVVAMAAGDRAGYALTSGGRVWAWGDNRSGQLGVACGQYSTVPVEVAGLTGVEAIAAAGDTAYALKADGSVWCWGLFRDGIPPAAEPLVVPTPSRIRDAAEIAAVAAHYCGSIWAWGADYEVLCQRLWPWAEETPQPCIKELTLDGFPAYILTAEGTVLAWCLPREGEIPSHILHYPPWPTEIAGLSSVRAVAGRETGYALRSDGTVWAWGENLGRPGWGAGLFSATPLQVPGLTNVIAITAGTWDAYALKDDGTVWTWGHLAPHFMNSEGLPEPCGPPVPLPGLSTVVALAAGHSHGYALCSDGSVWAWGDNTYGQLGNGETGCAPPGIVRVLLPPR